jgi:hypothetical protein
LTPLPFLAAWLWRHLSDRWRVFAVKTKTNLGKQVGSVRLRLSYCTVSACSYFKTHSFKLDARNIFPLPIRTTGMGTAWRIHERVRVSSYSCDFVSFSSAGFGHV